jgi:hypothetical protein
MARPLLVGQTSCMTVTLSGPHGTFVLPLGTSVLGRGAGCELHIDDPRLSRRHAALVVSEVSVVVQDLGATNGVLVNGDRVAKQRELHQDDVMVCGPVALRVLIDPTISPPPAVKGSGGEFKPHHERSRTDAMDPVESAKAGAALTDRKLNASIAASLGIDPPPAKPPTTSSVLKSDEVQVQGSALIPHRADQVRQSTFMPASFGPPPASALSSGGHGGPPPASPYPDALRSSTIQPGQLPPGIGAEPLQLLPGRQARGALVRRAIALVGDLTVWTAAGGCVALPAIVIGYGLGLQRAGAVLIDRLPVLPPASGDPVGLASAAASLAAPGGLARALDIGLVLQRTDPGAFFLLFVGATIAVLAWVLAALFLLVAPTVLTGSPRMHHRQGLRLASTDGGSPGWGRAALRWVLCLLLWPLAPATAVAGLPSIHDLLAGTRLVDRRAEAPVG